VRSAGIRPTGSSESRRTRDDRTPRRCRRSSSRSDSRTRSPPATLPTRVWASARLRSAPMYSPTSSISRYRRIRCSRALRPISRLVSVEPWAGIRLNNSSFRPTGRPTPETVARRSRSWRYSLRRASRRSLRSCSSR
jgi:hypothetical protein